MSALGHLRTLKSGFEMSALPVKADIRRRQGHVRLVPKADMALAINLCGCSIDGVLGFNLVQAFGANRAIEGATMSSDYQDGC